MFSKMEQGEIMLEKVGPVHEGQSGEKETNHYEGPTVHLCFLIQSFRKAQKVVELGA